MQLIISIIKGGIEMPARNGTGPRGMGPMTGWGRGWCAGGGGMGRGFGGYGRFGMGRGFGGVWGAPVSPEMEEQALRQEMDMLRSRMDELQARLGKENKE